ncbi:MAG: hypothetical protein ACYCYP_13200 [Leptospirales bacterium]
MNNSSLRDGVLSKVPEAAHKGILELALDYGVNNPDDPVWAMVGLAWSAAKGAELTRERLEIIRRETASIPGKITEGTEQAGADLRTIINTEITEKMEALRGTLVRDIDKAAGNGAEAIRKAQDGLDDDIEKKREAAVQEFATAAGNAAESHARKAFERARTTSWTTVVLSLLGSAIIASGGTIGLGYLLHRVTPSEMRVWSDPDVPGKYEFQFENPIRSKHLPDCPSGFQCWDFTFQQN